MLKIVSTYCYYETYIGSLTVSEFLDNMEVEAAIDNVIETWPWEDSIPVDFRAVIKEYCEAPHHINTR
jgi:hypothetical protein